MDDFTDLGMFEEVDYTFMVDSSKRDMTHYPSPSQYTIALTNPFRNVVAMNLLRAHIPRTQYVITEANNTLSFAFGTPSTEHRELTRISLQPGDYNLPQLCDELNRQFAAAASSTNSHAITASPLTNPAEITNKVAFDCPRQFYFQLDPLGIGEKIGFATPVQRSGLAANSYAASEKWKGANWMDTDVFVSVETVSQQEGAAYLGPVAAEDSFLMGPGGASGYAQYFTAVSTGPASSISIAMTVPQASSPATVEVEITDSSGSVVGTGQGVVSATDTLFPATVALTSGLPLVAGNRYRIEIACSDPARLYYARTDLAPDPGNSLEVHTDGGAWQELSTSDSISATVYVKIGGYRLTSPGVVNLVGDRFLTIRCPEVESYLYKDRAVSEVHPGIGMCTLGTYGFVAETFDYVNYKPPKLTTPIGKLSKLTIRLETSTGTLYDTQGVNHTLLVNVRCLVPKIQRPTRTGSLIAPEYRPGQIFLSREHW